jgi:phospholipase/lecithinase/hemolysin
LSYLLNPVTVNFDSQLAKSLPDYVTQFDTFGLLNAVVANPSGYGFSNVTDACISVPTCVNGTLAQQNQYLFWDDAHPTTAAFSVLAGQFSATVAAVPEPADAALLGSGLLVVLAATRSRQRRSGLVARRAMA